MIKLLEPNLPTTEQLLPYLKMIEETGIATNNGPLVQLLEQRLSDHYDGAHVICTSSGTAALELCHSFTNHHGKTDATTQALTFPATALAAYNAGLEVTLADVDPDTWTRDVCSFGNPVMGNSWDILDAAGAFGEQIVTSGMIACFSLHATKVICAGEGGYIVTWDGEVSAWLRKARNFGMDGIGVSTQWGTNAKMSEYHAAVALASLANYRREPWLRLFDWYEKYLPACVVRQKRPRGVYPMIAVKLPGALDPVMQYMKNANIETRRWYYPCLAEHPLFALENWREKLPVTADLSDHLLGLPWHLRISEDDVISVCDALCEAIK